MVQLISCILFYPLIKSVLCIKPIRFVQRIFCIIPLFLRSNLSNLKYLPRISCLCNLSCLPCFLSYLKELLLCIWFIFLTRYIPLIFNLSYLSFQIYPILSFWEQSYLSTAFQKLSDLSSFPSCLFFIFNQLILFVSWSLLSNLSVLLSLPHTCCSQLGCLEVRHTQNRWINAAPT